MDVLNHRDLPFSIPSVCVDPWPRDETTHMSCINQMQGNAYNKSDQLRRCFVIDLQTRYGWSNITESMAELWLTGVNNTVSKSTLLLEFEGTITFRFNTGLDSCWRRNLQIESPRSAQFHLVADRSAAQQ